MPFLLLGFFAGGAVAFTASGSVRDVSSAAKWAAAAAIVVYAAPLVNKALK